MKRKSVSYEIRHEDGDEQFSTLAPAKKRFRELVKKDPRKMGALLKRVYNERQGFTTYERLS